MQWQMLLLWIRLEESGDGMISFSFIKDGSAYRMMKEIRKEALMHLSLAFKESNELSSWLPLSITELNDLEVSK